MTSYPHRFLVLVIATGVAVTGCAASPGAPAAPEPPPVQVYTLEHPEHRNPAGIVWDAAGKSFLVGAYNDGTLYRGRLDNPSVPVYREGRPGQTAVGMTIADGLLYVAGGIYGTVAVHDLGTGAQVGTFSTDSQENILDLVVTEAGDLWATDAARPLLWHWTAEQVAAGTGAATAIPVDPEVHYGRDQHDLGGIVALDDRRFVVVDYSDGTLYRIDVDPQAARGRTITRIDGATAPRGAGMIRDGNRLVVADDAGLSLVELSGEAARATIVGQVRDPSFRHAFDVARADDRYLVLNAAFTQPAPYTVTSVSATG